MMELDYDSMNTEGKVFITGCATVFLTIQEAFAEGSTGLDKPGPTRIGPGTITRSLECYLYWVERGCPDTLIDPSYDVTPTRQAYVNGLVEALGYFLSLIPECPARRKIVEASGKLVLALYTAWINSGEEPIELIKKRVHVPFSKN